MANFSYVRPLGVWAPNQPILHGELQQFDQNLVKAPNFAEGGAYAPSSIIIVGGAGLRITTLFDVSGNAVIGGTSANTLQVNATTGFRGNVVFGPTGPGTFTCNFSATFADLASFQSNISVQGTSTFNGLATFQQVEIEGNVEFLGTQITTGTATFQGAATFNQHVAFTNDVDFSHTVEFHEAADFDAAVDFHAPTTFADAVNITSQLKLGIGGKIVGRSVLGANAHTTYFPAAVDSIIIPLSNTLTNDWTYTIDDAGAADGMTFEVANQTHGANHKITITGTNLDGTYPVGHVEAQAYIKFRRIGGIWYAINKVAPV